MSRYHVSSSEGEYEKDSGEQVLANKLGSLLLMRWMRLNLSC